MNNSQSLTRAQVEKLVKENPKFAAELAKAQKESSMVNGDSGNSVKLYYDLKTARSELGLLHLGRDGDVTSGASIVTKNKPHVCSGLIEDKRFLFTPANKSEVLINFSDEIFDGIDYAVIPKEEKIQETCFINSNSPSELIRINIVYINGENIEVVSHFEKKDCAVFGKDKLLYTCELKTRANEEGIVCAHQRAFFNIDPTNNTIKVSCDPNGLTTDGTWIFIPIMVKASMLRNIEEEVETKYNNFRCDIVTSITGHIPENADEKLVEKYNKLTSYVDSCLYGNPYVDKYALVKAYESNTIVPFKIEDFCEENSDEIDELNISGALFPRFGYENIHIDENKYEKNGVGLPILNEKVKANIKVLGISKEMIQNIINSANETVSVAKENIKAATKSLEDINTEVYDAECKMCVDIDTDRWVDTAFESAETIVNKVSYQNEIDSSEKFIHDTEMQLLGFINLSDRIQGKINRGEFSNAYLLTCVSVFWKMVANRLELSSDKTNILTALYSLMNYYYLRGQDKMEMIKRKNDSFMNTLVNRQGVKDKFGSENKSVEYSLANLSTSIFKISDIPENIPEEEYTDEVIERVMAKYEFIKAIAVSPLGIISKLYPEIKAASNGTEVSENDKTLAEKYRSEVGFEGIDTDEYRVLVEAIVSAIKASRESVSTDNGAKLSITAIKNANEYAKKLESKNLKKNKLLDAYIRSVVTLDNTSYMEPVATGLKSVGEAEILKPEETIYVSIDDENVRIDTDAYNKLVEEDKSKYVRCRLISDNEKVNIVTELMLRISLVSSFCTIIYKLFNDYSDAAANSNVNSDAMMMSTLSLIVPSLQILETVNLSKIEGYFDPMSVIDGDKKVKLGSSAIKESIGSIKDAESLKEARKEYVLECLKFVETSFNS